MQEGVSSVGYEVKTLVEYPRFSNHRIRLIKVSDGLQSKSFFLLVPQTLEWNGMYKVSVKQSKHNYTCYL